MILNGNDAHAQGGAVAAPFNGWRNPKGKPAGVPTIKPGANTSLGGFNLRRFLHEY